MWKKIAVTGAIAAAVVGIGTASMALTGNTVAPTPGGSSAQARPGPEYPALRKLAGRTLHGQFVTRGKDSTFVTHDVIRGDVTAVSATSISVKAADGVTQQYTVTGDTKVRVRSDGSGKAGAITDVHTGDKALVLGTGTGPFTATLVIVAK